VLPEKDITVMPPAEWLVPTAADILEEAVRSLKDPEDLA
jgi:hypothetical protein